MQFVVIGYDGKDDGAMARRLAVRDQHIALCDECAEKGEQILGVALLDDAGKMCGSVMIMNFPSRKELDAWLAKEPYVTGEGLGRRSKSCWANSDRVLCIW